MNKATLHLKYLMTQYLFSSSTHLFVLTIHVFLSNNLYWLFHPWMQLLATSECLLTGEQAKTRLLA